ncbi:MAG: ATP-binding cassette domain-containing protein [Deltaproteobacteria bacterium]|nr:ATP-binding cassette domain-containing protein [Deltaproteobacteria bacterium]
MSLVNVLNISLTFSEKRLFHNINFQLNPGEHVGLAGPNGSGKTTLLRLLIGKISPDNGEIRIAKGIRIGYLPQDVHGTLSGPLLQSTLNSIPGRACLRNEISKIEQSLRKGIEGQEQIKLAARLAQIHQETGDLDTQFPVHKGEEILLGLGFKSEDFNKPIATLSGGWKTRAALGSLLYQNPDCLLLDEPTNHLDLPSIRWLEEFLQGYKGAMILICHDRDFLNRQIKRVISFEPEGLRSYSGNYDFYLKTREEERKSLKAKARNQELKIREAKKFIERFRAKASKARQAQSKIKLIKKKELIKTYRKDRTINFSFPQVARSGSEVLAIKEVSKGYDNRILYKDLNLAVFRGERVAIIGPNGSGKTTLLRMVAGEIDPDQGMIVSGHGVTMSYYAQHLSEMLDPGKTIIEEVYQVVPYETVSFVRTVCGAFLFSGKDVDKVIGILSGGERARVSLAKILVKPGNFLVMDEPTNHLDIISSEILIDALSGFNGTLLFVSHNQSFVNRLATKIWDIKEESILEYPGRLYEYYNHLAALEERPLSFSQQEREGAKVKVNNSSQKDLQSRKIKRREKAEKRQLISATLKPIQDKLLELEERISDLEKREKELGKILADPDIFRDKKRGVPLLKEYGEVKGKMEELMRRWEYNQDELESAKRDLEGTVQV